MSTETKELRFEEIESLRFQFSLSTLFIVTTLVAVSCSLLWTMPNVTATFSLLAVSLALPAVFTTVLIYGRGYRRTFCLGALFPAGAMLVCSNLMVMIHAISAYQNDTSIWMEFADKVGPYYRPFVGAAWVLCILIGLLCVGVRWLTERSNRNRAAWARQDH
jgi:hypothetical protein